MAKQKMVTLTFNVDDIEPTLRDAAYQAALYSARLDHVTLHMWNSPHSSDPKTDRVKWTAIFLRAKRIVESFGVEYEQVSEAETVRSHAPIPGASSKCGKSYQETVHYEACKQAAARVVRKWRALQDEASKAAA